MGSRPRRASGDVPEDPSGIEQAHDILAADEFPPPAGPDADTPVARAHRELPGDPSGISEPHDVLAAEEFPPPAGPDAAKWAAAPTAPRARRTPVVAIAGALVLLALALRRARR